ncbi:MAG: carbohydrate ABC transporter permease [Spirochaetae bacterium HGW-Spirochaetae-3]|jgi:multiple sugar transport system permease protein|nr:MAG: carbohydrate ABC transporter permease [Spirochaetae bacterium HGW-Spirochaetae-3]
MTMANRRKTITTAVMFFAIALLLIELYPIIITLLNGFRRDIVILSGQKFELNQLTLDSYMLVFKNRQMMKAMGNSVIVGLLSTALSVGVGAMAAYGISRFKFRGRNALAYSFLVFRMLPQMSLVVALYMMFKAVGLRDTIFGITLAHSSFNVPYVIWMLIPFFTAVDKSYEEAAMVDGCTRWTLFKLVFLPLVAPGLVVAAVFAFINSWNEFLYALILTGVKARTAPVAISSLIGGDTLTWGQMCAASTVMLTPVFVFTLAMQRFLIRGVAAGGVKG